MIPTWLFLAGIAAGFAGGFLVAGSYYVRPTARVAELERELTATQTALAAYAQDRWGGGTKAVERLLGLNRTSREGETS